MMNRTTQYSANDLAVAFLQQRENVNPVRQETFTLSQKELQRVAAVPFYAPATVSTRNSYFSSHLSEKLVEREGFSLSCETLRRLLCAAGLGLAPQAAARPPTASVACAGLARPHDRLERRGPSSPRFFKLTLPAKILAAQFYSSETAAGYFHLLQNLLHRFGVPLVFYADRSSIFVCNQGPWSLAREDSSANGKSLGSFALWSKLGITLIAAQNPQAKGRIERLWARSRVSSPVNCALPTPALSISPIASCTASWTTTTVVSQAVRAMKPQHGAWLRRIWIASIASPTNGLSAMTTSCNGRTLFADRAATTTVQFGRCQSSASPSARWARLALLSTRASSISAPG